MWVRIRNSGVFTQKLTPGNLQGSAASIMLIPMGSQKLPYIPHAPEFQNSRSNIALGPVLWSRKYFFRLQVGLKDSLKITFFDLINKIKIETIYKHFSATMIFCYNISSSLW
jgi:hypothetical protein